jgi:hypothetical protein
VERLLVLILVLAGGAAAGVAVASDVCDDAPSDTQQVGQPLRLGAYTFELDLTGRPMLGPDDPRVLAVSLDVRWIDPATGRPGPFTQPLPFVASFELGRDTGWSVEGPLTDRISTTGTTFAGTAALPDWVAGALDLTILLR